MKKRYLLPLLQGACFVLISLLLQSCGSSNKLPIEGEEELITIEPEEQGRRKRARIETQEEHEQNLIEQGQEISCFDIFPAELWQEIFSHLDFEGVLSARAVNSGWNQLITGYREAGVVGAKNKPHHNINTRSWTRKEKINFRSHKLAQIDLKTIPSFTFYHLMGYVNNLPQSFWPHLQETQVHTLYLTGNEIGAAEASELVKALAATQVHTLNLDSNQIGATGARELAKALSVTCIHTLGLINNQIGDAGAIELAKALPATRVHTLYLGGNEIGAAGVSELIKVLPATRVHTLDLGGNAIGDAGANELAKALPATRVHTLNLGGNEIGAAGASELIKALPATRVHTLDLGGNEIGDAGAIELAKALPATRVHTLNLGGNEIGDAGASELAKVLPATRIHTLNLGYNQIETDTQELLVEQYPQINWEF
jgi:hypothetical protein